MADSMIPYSFIPGTKAKAGEVNANFIALADAIENNRQAATGDIEELNETLETKADKTELVNEHTVTDSGTDLNNYKTKGTYIFSEVYKPYNIPNGNSGTLIVTGDSASLIKQIWFGTADNSEIFTRNFINSAWTGWYSITGIFQTSNPGYLRFPDGVTLQWGWQTGAIVTYPIAFGTVACVSCCKNGWAGHYERTDTGIDSQSLTGFTLGSAGVCNSVNWIAIGY